MNSSLELNKEKILLSNLVNIRWIAILGQIFAILLVYYYLEIKIPIFFCSLVVAVSIFINFISSINNKQNNYLSDNEAFYFLLFDIIQLAILLYLTGGIYNPFSLLILAPVIVSSSFLRIGFSIFLLLLSIIIIIFISFFYIEIQWSEDFKFPILFIYGIVFSLIISLIFISIYVYILNISSRKISEALNQTQLALINQKKISEVGSLTAAAVHELSTPLSTIFLIISDLKKNKSLNKNKDLNSEIILLESQAKRCKNILFNLSKDPQNIRDNFLKKILLSNIIKINFDKFKKKDILLNIKVKNDFKEPLIKYSDEIMYGIGNIIQNASEHAKNIINVEITWTKLNVYVQIIDDGNGFDKEILDRIGSPFISSKNREGNMGLGIFIAKNLIERVGGQIKFFNNTNVNGSIVEIRLNRHI